MRPRSMSMTIGSSSGAARATKWLHMASRMTSVRFGQCFHGVSPDGYCSMRPGTNIRVTSRHLESSGHRYPTSGTYQEHCLCGMSAVRSTCTAGQYIRHLQQRAHKRPCGSLIRVAQVRGLMATLARASISPRRLPRRGIVHRGF